MNAQSAKLKLLACFLSSVHTDINPTLSHVILVPSHGFARSFYGSLKLGFWILRELHSFRDFYSGFVDKRSVSNGHYRSQVVEESSAIH